MLRSGFKTSDQVQGQGVRPIGKAQSRRRRDEQYIYRRSATQPLGLRWGFETTSSRALAIEDPGTAHNRDPA
jgi:hypothetical protein